MILVTGATGKTGGELARQLTQTDIPFSAIARSREKAADLLDMDADVVFGDLEDRGFSCRGHGRHREGCADHAQR